MPTTENVTHIAVTLQDRQYHGTLMRNEPRNGLYVLLMRSPQQAHTIAANSDNQAIRHSMDLIAQIHLAEMERIALEAMGKGLSQ